MRPLPAVSLLSLSVLCAACAPPPLSADDTGSSGGGGDGDPSVRILFPFTSASVVVCPEFVMVLDIDNFDVVDFNSATDVPADEGHWHLFDGSDYLTNYVEEWGLVQLDHEGGRVEHILTAQLALNDHTLLDHTSTVEIVVDDSEDCIGGDHKAPPASDDGATDTGTQ